MKQIHQNAIKDLTYLVLNKWKLDNKQAPMDPPYGNKSLFTHITRRSPHSERKEAPLSWRLIIYDHIKKKHAPIHISVNDTPLVLEYLSFIMYPWCMYKLHRHHRKKKRAAWWQHVKVKNDLLKIILKLVPKCFSIVTWRFIGSINSYQTHIMGEVACKTIIV